MSAHQVADVDSLAQIFDVQGCMEWFKSKFPPHYQEKVSNFISRVFFASVDRHLWVCYCIYQRHLKGR